MKLLGLEFYKCRRRKILLVCAAVLAAVWLYFYPAAGCGVGVDRLHLRPPGR